MILKSAGIVIYMAVLVGIGVAASRHMRSSRDYFAAGKSLGYLPVAFSARATGESAWLLLGLTGMGAAVGLQALWVVLGELLGVAGAWLLMARRFKRLTDQYDSITIPDYLESRFNDRGHRLRIIAAGSLVIFVTIYISAQIDATGKAFESFLGFNYYGGALFGFLVVIAYTTFGGFLAVAWSDVFQGFLMFLGLTVLPLVALLVGGGWTALATRLEAIDQDLFRLWPQGEVVVSIAGVLGLLLIGLGFLGSPQIFVRFIALRSEDEIRTGTTVALLWTLLAECGAVLIGMIGRALLTVPGQSVEVALGTGGENVLPLLVADVMPLFVVGLYIAIVLAAIMSTIDSLLVVAASSVVRDFHHKVRNPEISEESLVPMSRYVTVILALLAFLLAIGVALVTPERTIFWFVIFGWSGIAATFCPTMILSLYWRGMTARGAMAAMIVGFLSVPLFKFVAPQLSWVGPIFDALGELPPAFVLSGLAALVATKLGSRASRDPSTTS